jgi:hypothetical protein
MSVDRNTTIWHLTPAGWVFGVDGMYLSDAKEKENTPVNRLLSLKYEEYQSSQYSKPEHYMRVNYVNERRYADVVCAILTHGLYPDHGAGQPEPQASNNNKYMVERYQQDMALANVITKSPLFAKKDKQRAQ